MSRPRRRRPVRRVSSAATSPTDASVSRARSERSSEVPDRRADEVEDAAHTPMVPGSPPPTMVRMAQPHKDYSGTPLPKKLGIREGCAGPRRRRARGLRRRPRSSADGRPAPRARSARTMDVVLLFVTRGARPAFAIREARGRRSSPPDGSGSRGRRRRRRVPSDLDFDTVQRIGLDAGLVDNKSASITEAFQGLQFVYRLKDRPR